MKRISINARQKRFLFLLPGVVLPFLCLFFYALGGGRGTGVMAGVRRLGINMELPGSKPDPKQSLLNKLGIYEKAGLDSLRKRQYEAQDPYRADTASTKRHAMTYAGRTLAPMARPPANPIREDPRAEQLLQELGQLKESLHQPRAPAEVKRDLPDYRHGGELPLTGRRQDTAAADPQVSRINELLDKVIRIQHPEEAKAKPQPSRAADEVLPADSGVNGMIAITADNQTLTNGTTLALRITDSIKINGRLIPGGQLVYGTVTINNDRMMVRIPAIREDRSLFAVDLQVYDMDGLAGIHIPNALGRDVAKQSADQGVNSLNVLNVDPSLGAQAASAGIQTAKTFLGHKVRQVRVSVKAGYQVLLKEAHAREARYNVKVPGGFVLDEVRPPGFDPGGPVLKSCRNEGIELALRDVGLADGRLWFGLEWMNRTAIAYQPAYIRWYTRDRHVFRRTAVQELPLEPATASSLPLIAGDSVGHSWTGFAPFALAKDKELVVEIGEKDGGRVLVLNINGRFILNAKKLEP